MKLSKDGMVIKPKVPVDKGLAGSRFFQMVDEVRQEMKDADPAEVEALIEEAVRAVRGKAKAKQTDGENLPGREHL